MRHGYIPILLLSLTLGGCATGPGFFDGAADDDDPEMTQSGRGSAGTAGRTPGVSPLEEGMAAYEAGRFDAAINAFNRALDTGRMPPAQQVEIRKHIAFALCATRRITLCKKEFREILRIDPKFALTKAEAGHPTWGRAFAEVRKNYDSVRR